MTPDHTVGQKPCWCSLRHIFSKIIRCISSASEI